MRRTWLMVWLAALPGIAHAKAQNETSPRRPEPEYGAPPRGVGARPLLLVPKLVLLPPYVVWNYGIRKPLGLLISTAERRRWPAFLFDVFTFGPERNAGIVPTVLFDFGIKPSVGVFAWWSHVLHPNNSVNAHFGFWGPSWLNATAADRFRIGPESFITLSGRFTRRPDMPFYGLGSRSLATDRVRYTSNVKELGLGFDLVPGATRTTAPQKADDDTEPPARHFRVLTRVGIRSGDFSEGRYQNEPTVDPDGSVLARDTGLLNAARLGVTAVPPGFSNGYVASFQRVEVEIDTRHRRPASQTGIKIVAEAEHGADVRNASGASWIRWGGTAGAFLDVGRNRTFGLTFTGLFSDPLRGQVPFTELVNFGGATYMRGYLWNRMIGRSGAIATLEYNWPIWVVLDGTIQASFGNVFDAHFDGFSPKLLRLSGAVGVRTSSTPNQSFETLFGFGTETFADGFQVNSFRLVIGTNRF